MRPYVSKQILALKRPYAHLEGGRLTLRKTGTSDND
jgi:hypothetical protein